MTTFEPLKNPAAVISMLSRISIFGGVSDAQQSEIFGWLETGAESAVSGSSTAPADTTTDQIGEGILKGCN